MPWNSDRVINELAELLSGDEVSGDKTRLLDALARLDDREQRHLLAQVRQHPDTYSRVLAANLAGFMNNNPTF